MGSDQLRALLEEGLNNRAIARQTGCSLRKVAQARKDAGIPPAPRSSWERRPHPKQDDIRALLTEGHTDTAVREATGADVSTIARMRREGGFGPATITRNGTRPHPQHAAILRLLEQRKSTAAVARELGVDRAAVRRIRREAGLPTVPMQPLTLEEAWATHTKPVDGGHIEWTGSRASGSGTPVMRYKDAVYTAAAIAFRQHTGRDPVGHAKAECGMAQCVEPSHIEDEPGRAHIREQLRNVLGKGARQPFCRRDHDQAVHGRYGPNGTAYCQACQDVKRGRVPEPAG
ncbi:helix-turn-helix domain-containing protein [Streptomyces sp. M41(2017)]|uniref:helix-turn-helix domain-containing protein n=1 Tax=Streptomyces sp. M41(2017) TaxID=1955065 RepID=UPI001F4E72AF|nr:helix-turn-helix domain-containing protein [Streptomyces sp. M41(2017)]